MRLEYGYIIAGAGSAGSAVVRRIVERTSATVLLIEVGGDERGITLLDEPTRLPENCVTISPGVVSIASRGHLKLLSADHDGRLEIRPNIPGDRADADALVAAIGVWAGPCRATGSDDSPSRRGSLTSNR